MKPQFCEMSEEEYYSDPLPEPSLSSSVARELLKTPWHGYLAHPRLGGGRSAVTKAMEEGSILDSLLTGGASRYIETAHADWRKKEAREERDAIRAQGNIPLTAGALDEWKAVANAIKSSLESQGKWPTGKTQMVAIWEETATSGRKVWCRARLDFVDMDRQQIWDLKSVGDISDKGIVSTIAGGCLVQEAAYMSAANAIAPGNWEYNYIFGERAAPNLARAARSSGEMQEIGRLKWRKAVDVWDECTHNNRWPAYEGTFTAFPPAWLQWESEVI